MRAAVVGSGAWGTALAISLHKNGSEVTLWTYKEAYVEHMRATRINPKLPGVLLPEAMQISTDPDCVAGCKLVVIACPSFAIRSVCRRIAPHLSENAVLVLAVGGAMSVYSLGKGIVKANAAKTDAEAETAWQNIGEGTTGVVMTAVGAKALKTSKAATAAEALRYKGIKGYGRALKDVYVDAGKGIKQGYTHVKENGITSSLRTAKDVSKDYITSSWEGRFR